jgi:hypothetical protein
MASVVAGRAIVYMQLFRLPQRRDPVPNYQVVVGRLAGN